MRSLVIALGFGVLGLACSTPTPPAVPLTPSNGAAPSVGTHPPSGTYSVIERVDVDSCRGPKLPAQVSVLTYTASNQPLGSVPFPGQPGEPPQRLEVDWRGTKGTGGSVSQTCPGVRTEYRFELRDVTPTSFKLSLDQTLSDAESCPGAQSGERCRTDTVYEYTLVSSACPSNCDGSFAGIAKADHAPSTAGPIQCRCP